MFKKYCLSIFIVVCFLSCKSNSKAPDSAAYQPNLTLDTTAADTSGLDTAVTYAPYTGRDTAKTVYLTFDDGPLPGTQNILAVMNGEELPATMFVVGAHTLADTAMHNDFELAYNDHYLEVASHSFSHANNHYQQYYAHPQGVLDDFNKNQLLLNLPDKDARMPGRNTWRIGNRKRDDPVANGSEAADLLHKNGYDLFGWDLEWQHRADGRPVQTVQQMLQEITTAITNPKKCFTPYHFVLLSHDEMFQKPWEESELKQLVDALRRQGYQFEQIEHYPRR